MKTLMIMTSLLTTAAADIDRLEQVYEKNLAECQTTEQVTNLAGAYLKHLRELDPSDRRFLALRRAQAALDDPETHVRPPEPASLKLATFWQNYSGSEEALQEFGDLLGSGSTEVDLEHHDISFPTGGSYLMKQRELLKVTPGLADTQNTDTTNKDVRHPGWPSRSFDTVTYVGDFHYGGYRFNSLQLVVDSDNQVVATQLKNDGGRSASNLGGTTRRGYFNFVSSRRKADGGSVTAKSVRSGNLRVIYTTLTAGGRVRECCVLFIPEPVAALCRRIVNDQ